MVNAARDVYLENKSPALAFFLISSQMENALDGNVHNCHSDIQAERQETLSNTPSSNHYKPHIPGLHLAHVLSFRKKYHITLLIAFLADISATQIPSPQHSPNMRYFYSYAYHPSIRECIPSYNTCQSFLTIFYFSLQNCNILSFYTSKSDSYHFSNLSTHFSDRAL